MTTRGSMQPDAGDFDRQLPIAAIRDEYCAVGRRKVEAWIGSRYDAVETTPGSQPFHMSGGVCAREDVFSWAGARKAPTSGRSSMQAAIGNMIENVCEAACAWKGILVAAQIRLWRDWRFRAGRGHVWRTLTGEGGASTTRLDLGDALIAGTADAVLIWNPAWAAIEGPIEVGVVLSDLDRPGTMVFGIDWKSVHSMKFKYLDKEVDASYAMQLANYCEAWREQMLCGVAGVERWPYGDEGLGWHVRTCTPEQRVRLALIDQARLIYVCREDMRIRQVGVDLATWGPQALARCRSLRSHAEAWVDSEGKVLPGELPFATEGKKKGQPEWKCDPRYCGFCVALNEHGEARCPRARAWWLAQAQALGDDADGIALWDAIDAGKALYPAPALDESAPVEAPVECKDKVEASENEAAPAAGGSTT